MKLSAQFIFLRVVMVVGAGRGPLVTASITAAAKADRNIRVYAVEKNANAVVTWVVIYIQFEKRKQNYVFFPIDFIEVYKNNIEDWWVMNSYMIVRNKCHMTSDLCHMIPCFTYALHVAMPMEHSKQQMHLIHNCAIN